MQTASYVDIDNWSDLDPNVNISNIRPKGTYKPVIKPDVTPEIPPVCPVDNQPIPVPCDLCPINNLNNDSCDCNIAIPYGVAEENVVGIPVNEEKPKTKRGRKPAAKKSTTKKSTKKN